MRKLRLTLGCIAAVLSLTACSVATILPPTKDPSQFFVLTPLGTSARGVPTTYKGTGGISEIEIGLGPVKFPAYLARPEIVTRSGPNQVDLSEINRWAEPLDKNFVSVVSQNLATDLSAHVLTFPWYRPTNLDFQITMDVTRFDTDSAGTAVALGRWEIKDPNSGDVLDSGELNITEPAPHGETVAATLSRAAGDVSGQLGDAIRATKAPPRTKSD